MEIEEKMDLKKPCQKHKGHIKVYNCRCCSKTTDHYILESCICNEPDSGDSEYTIQDEFGDCSFCTNSSICLECSHEEKIAIQEQKEICDHNWIYFSDSYKSYKNNLKKCDKCIKRENLELSEPISSIKEEWEEIEVKIAMWDYYGIETDELMSIGYFKDGQVKFERYPHGDTPEYPYKFENNKFWRKIEKDRRKER